MKTTKTLKDYTQIYKNINNASISEIAEAAAYFSNIGGQFNDRAKELKEALEKFSTEDLKKETGAEQLSFDFGDYEFGVKPTETSTSEVDVDSILKLDGSIDPKYFKKVVNKEAVVKDYKAATLPDFMRPFVTIYTKTTIAIRKKATKKGK